MMTRTPRPTPNVTRNPLVTSGMRVRDAMAKTDDLVLLVVRLTLGILFVSTGWGKVHNLEKVIGFFKELGIPAPGFQATLVSFTELLGGTAIVLGLATRLASIPLLVTMVVAILTAKKDEIHGLPDLFGQVEWTYLVLFLVLVAFGPGRASLDHVIATKLGAEKRGTAGR